MSSRSLTKEKSDKSLVKTGYNSPGKRGNSTGGSIDTSSGKAESELARKSSERSLTRGDSKKNFNADGTSAREFNRDGSLRSIAKDKNSNSSVGNEAESPPKASKSSSKKDIVAISDVDSMIKQVSTKDMILSGEIDAFISDIENKLSGDEGKSKSPPRKTVKNASLRSMLLDGTHDFDRYGFLITKPDSEAFVLSTDELQKRLDKEDERTDKWIYMLNHWDYFFLKKFNKIKSRVRKGIPHAIRGEAWHRLAHVDDMKVLFPLALDLDNLEERLDPHVVDEIGRDINRTFPSHRLFQEGGPGQEALRRVLQRYAILDPAIGYCQGMGFLAALLLQYLHEHDAFYALVSLMNRPSLPFRGMYSPGMEDTKKTLSVFAILAEVKVPKVWKHLVQQGIHHSMFVTSWIMTVFVSSFHFEFAARVWDALWVEGWKVVYKVCLGLLKYAEDELLTCNMEEIMMYFRKMPERMDPDLVWKYVWDVKVSQQEILRCEQWYHEEGGTQ